MFINNQEKGIIGLAVLFTVGFFALGLAVTSTTGALLELKKNRNTEFGDQSFHTAESFSGEGVYQFLNNINYSGDSTYSQSLNNNSNGAIIVNDDPVNWPYVEINGNAENPLAYREVVNLVTVFAEGIAFDYAIYSQNDLYFGGNAQVNGNIFANNEIDFHGNAYVYGDAGSTGEIGQADHISDDIFENSQFVPPPQIDLQVYVDDAIANGTFFNDPNDAEIYLNGQIIGSEISPEVIFVNEETGKTKIQGAGTNLTGSLVIKNSLDLTGGTYTAGENHAAIVVLGDFKVAGGVTINGIVYVLGSTDFGAGNNTINGSLISAGGVNHTDITGNAEINYDPYYVGDWTDHDWISHTSAAPPRLIGWEER